MLSIIAVSVVPSPYQRDFFWALSAHPGVDLRVYYTEAAAPDSPWGKMPLRDFETVLPGKVAGRGRLRCHVNWKLPDCSDADVMLVNLPTTGLTTQRLLRSNPQGVRKVFWGEVLLPKGGGIPGLLKGALRAPIDNCDLILGVGSGAVESYSSMFPETRVENLPYHIDLSDYRPHESRDPSDPIRFLFCGQMIERKGLDVLLAAFEKAVTEDGMNARLKLVGRQDSEGRWLDSLSASVREKVDLIGFVAPDDLPEVFLNSDVFVLPSRHDGWGVVVNQALGAGMPVIASDGAGAGVALVEDGVNGRIVRAGSVDDLRSALVELASDTEQRVSMSEAALESADILAPERGAATLVGYLRDICATPR